MLGAFWRSLASQWRHSKSVCSSAGTRGCLSPAKLGFVRAGEEERALWGQLGLSASLLLKSQDHKIFWVGRDPQGSSSPTLQWMVCTGVEPAALLMLADRADRRVQVKWWLSGKAYLLIKGHFIRNAFMNASKIHQLGMNFGMHHQFPDGKMSVFCFQPSETSPALQPSPISAGTVATSLAGDNMFERVPSDSLHSSRRVSQNPPSVVELWNHKCSSGCTLAPATPLLILLWSQNAVGVLWV